MAGKRVDPPKLKDGDDYDEWAREIEIWQIVTEVPVEKQGALIYLSLEGQARECCKSVETSKLKGQNGVGEIMGKLKELFAKDSEQAAFLAYEQFETYMRPAEKTMVEFINEWERRYAKIKEKKMELPDGVLAYRLLKSANVSDIQQTMVRTSITKLSVEQVKRQLKAVHDTIISSQPSSVPDPPIKLEPVYTCEQEEEESETYYTSGYGRGGRGRFQGRDQRSQPWNNRPSSNNHRAGYSRGNGNRGKHSGNRGGYNSRERGEENKDAAKPKRQINPPDRTGNPSKCAVCHSILHWASECPHREENITMFTKGIKEEYSNTFVRETFNSAVLDSGCSKTVCGRVWYDCYIDSLTDGDLQKVVENDSTNSFKFGSGQSFRSMKKVKVPARIGSMSISIETDIVDTEIPMLLSQNSMKKAKAKLNFGEDTVEMFGEKIKLNFTTSGHYMIDLNPKRIEREMKEISLISIEDADQDKQFRMAKKLHTQFGHPRSERLVDLVKDAGVESQRFLKTSCCHRGKL